ncbi:cell division protein FtsI/penicillin-binding protein 2 [Paenibacillus cellulosilyticus]|uniref:Cell division protein FtsI/penicillin-binding protein 2 n=1 Tax=Paenibacillus cellulosilyticus TaxID=375489 RepID=A0A2V2YQD5_9BACL|nr:penicillin-binding transpeptidase domain-containing protein [Paenibacillus cellulosilyticus]PWV98478.1 cell division protein FtsI/penicillin-binding protein 2 [Paenibacillus cellulosilyticus]QKS43318.1 penicillin-binding protein [Paenibacillus cellulosilyticus]
MQRRLITIAVALTVLFGICEWRLSLIELWPRSKSGSSTQVARQAVAQRDSELVIDTGRGQFVDRNGTPLTGKTINALALFPVREGQRGELAQLSRLASLLGVNVQQLQAQLAQLKEPSYWLEAGSGHPLALTDKQLEGLKTVHMNGIRVVPYRQRYQAPYLAAQTIGYISQHPERIKAAYGHEYATGKLKLNSVIGGAGLERSLDRLLRGDGETTASYYTDAAGQPLQGLDVRVTAPVNRLYPLQVVTTLDAKLQAAIEEYADRSGLKQGAIVVLDVATRDIVTMVSRPKLNPEQVDAAGTAAANHAIRAVEPGSIFKLVTEAAALEAGVSVPTETFHCNGEYGRYGLSDWKKGGHGELNLREGLAHSCNIVFATVAERLTAKQLSDTAFRLGIGRQIGWHSEQSVGPLAGPIRLLEEEESGQIFDRKQKSADGGVMAQTGIGQRDVRISPLQAANMIATIVNEGHVVEPRIVREIRYANGQRLVSFPLHEASSPLGRLSPAATHELMEGMQLVVREGTGRFIQNGLWDAAGKSGTAEVVYNGADRVNQWFIGYGPLKSPKYAIAVLAENRPPNTTNEATRLFRAILDMAAKQQS